tara:strand:+ start:795 stop:1079 length:285 start_codon:yes stop_codon:yes gene_type:complete
MSTYELGDIIRWKSYKEEIEYDYGMIIKEGQLITSGVYSFDKRLRELEETGTRPADQDETLLSITIYSFGQQKVITLYRNPEDLPLYIEKVKFS